jgi:hypothetical protein
MLHERHWREEFLRENCQWEAAILAKDGESVAACAGEIDGTDEGDRNQNNQGSEKSEDDHNNLLTI